MLILSSVFSELLHADHFVLSLFELRCMYAGMCVCRQRSMSFRARHARSLPSCVQCRLSWSRKPASPAFWAAASLRQVGYLSIQL